MRYAKRWWKLVAFLWEFKIISGLQDHSTRTRHAFASKIQDKNGLKQWIECQWTLQVRQEVKNAIYFCSFVALWEPLGKIVPAKGRRFGGQEELWTPEFPAFDNPGAAMGPCLKQLGTPGRLNQSHGKARFMTCIIMILYEFIWIYDI